MESWIEELDLTIWETEPPTVPENTFTQNADDYWQAWNMWSAEQQVTDFAATLVETIQPETIVETGMGQGYSTRRLINAIENTDTKLVVYEAEKDLRTRTEPHLKNYTTNPNVELANHPNPTQHTIQQADLLWLDSHWPERFRELRIWAQHGKPGSYAFLHDANPNAHPQSGHHQLANLIQQLDMPTMWFDNPRGSALLHKPENYQPAITRWPQARANPGETGSVFIVQIDPGEVNGAYTQSLVKMVTYSMQFPGLVAGYVRRTGGPRVYAHRDALVRHFLNETDASWLLQIDSDMVFHHTLLQSLISIADPQDRPIVAGHCYMLRGESGPLPTMWAEDPNGRGPIDLISQEGYPIGEVIEVGATGGACILIHRSVFEKIQATNPNYPFPWYEETLVGDKPIGEDITFCIRARQHGFPIFVHTGLDIGHMKQTQINHDFYRDWRRVRRFVVASTPRSATGYMSQLLQGAGIACGHERVYNLEGIEWKMRWGDSSWMSVPHLQQFDGTIFHMVRNPLHTVSSIMDLNFFGPDRNEQVTPYGMYAEQHALTPEEETLTPLTKTIRFVVRWHQKIVAARPNLSFRVEDMNPDLLTEILAFCRPPQPLPPSQLAEYINGMPTNINTRPETTTRPHQYTWETLHQADPEYSEQLQQMATDWGYDY